MRTILLPTTGLHRRVFATACGLLLAGAGLANEGAMDYRHHTMEAIGGHMEAAVDILKQKVPHQAHMALHANAIAEMAAIAETLFPAGSQGGAALPAIWEQPEEFAERLQAFKEAASGFRQAVSEGGEIGPAFQKLGGACKGCHDNFVDEG